MSAYKVTLGDVELSDLAPIRWIFKSGGLSYISNILVNEFESSQLDAIDKNISLIFEGPGAGVEVLEVKKLGILKRGKARGPNAVNYKIADRRYRLETMPVDRLFNALRRTNEKIIPGGDIDTSIAQFTAIPKLNFMPQYCRQESLSRTGDVQKFAKDAEDFEPWSVLTALRYLVSDQGYLSEVKDDLDITEFGGSTPFSFGTVDFSGATESKILLKNWNPRSTWPKAINYLLRQGKYLLYVDVNGQFVVRDQFPEDSQFSGFGEYRGAGDGLPIREDMYRMAPKRGIIRFAKRYEVRFDYIEKKDFATARTVTRNQIPLRLTPVFQMPNEVPGLAGAPDIQRGQYISQKDAFEAWETDRLGNSANNTFGNPWNLKNVRKYVLHTALAHNYCLDYGRPDYTNEILEARVATTYQQFRGRFQIPKELLDILEIIDDQSVEIVDSATGRRVVNKVICDYSAWDAISPTFIKNAGNGGSQGLRSYKAFGKDGDPSKFKWEDGKPAAVSLGIHDPVLGIVDLNFTTDLNGLTASYERGLIDPKTLPTKNWIKKNKKSLTMETTLSDQYRVSIKLSMVFRNNGDELKFLDYIEKNPDARFGFPTKPTGPTRVKYFRGFEAGYKWKFGQTLQINPQTNQPFFSGIDDKNLEFSQGLTTGGDLLNEAIIRDIGQAELNIMYFDYLPRIVGFYAAAGWTSSEPSGQVTSVEHYVGAGIRETVLRAPRPSPAPSIWSFFDPATRDFLGRFPGGTNEGARER